MESHSDRTARTARPSGPLFDDLAALGDDDQARVAGRAGELVDFALEALLGIAMILAVCAALIGTVAWIARAVHPREREREQERST